MEIYEFVMEKTLNNIYIWKALIKLTFWLLVCLFLFIFYPKTPFVFINFWFSFRRHL